MAIPKNLLYSSFGRDSCTGNRELWELIHCCVATNMRYEVISFIELSYSVMPLGKKRVATKNPASKKVRSKAPNYKLKYKNRVVSSKGTRTRQRNKEM